MEITTTAFKNHLNALKGMETCRTYLIALRDGVVLEKIKSNKGKVKEVKGRMKKYFPGGIIDKLTKGGSIYLMAAMFLEFLPEEYERFIFVYSVLQHWEWVPEEYEKVLLDGVTILLQYAKDVEDGGVPEYKEEFHQFLSGWYDQMKEPQSKKEVILETPPRRVKRGLEPPVLHRSSNHNYPVKKGKRV